MNDIYEWRLLWTATEMGVGIINGMALLSIVRWVMVRGRMSVLFFGRKVAILKAT